MEKYTKEKKAWDEKLLKLKDIAEKKLNALWLNFALHGLLLILI